MNTSQDLFKKNEAIKINYEGGFLNQSFLQLQIGFPLQVLREIHVFS